MEFKEVKRKDGQLLVFCNFEELLLELFNLNSLDELQATESSNGEYVCHCPFCKSAGHTKHKLYIKEDFTVGHCFVCTRTFINVTDKVDTSYSIPSLFTNFGHSRPSGVNLTRLTDPIWSLDRYFNEFEDYDEKGLKYLQSRHPFMLDIYDKLDFKFMDGNVVMPFKYKGDIFYYQIRFSGSNRIKYFFPPIANKPPYIIEHGENKKFIICEGIYDAISLLIQAPSYTPFAVLGSSISDYQLDFLREYVPEKIVIYMDSSDISYRIKAKIVSKIDYCPVEVIRSRGEDPEERMKRLLKRNEYLQWIK